MSKLSTLLRRAGRSEPAPMGFAAISSRTKAPEMVIGAVIAGADADAGAAAIKAGADLLLVESADLTSDVDKLKALIAAVSVPCGLRLDKPSRQEVAAARALGIDYLCIADEDTPAAAFLEDDIGFILNLAADADLADSALQVLQSTSFDALSAGSIGEALTLRRQLAMRRMAALTRKPLLLDARDNLTSEDLECLRDSGVAAVLAEAKGRSPARITALHQAVGAMQSRRKPKSERDSTALLPSVSHASEPDDDDE